MDFGREIMIQGAKRYFRGDSQSPLNSWTMIGHSIRSEVESVVVLYERSRLRHLIESSEGAFAIKFVPSRWAENYRTPAPLKISANPALTWGTATYVTPLAFPLSSALYGRIGLVTDYDPTGWRIFDATDPIAISAYVRWVQAQPSFSDLVLTVHSTHANHYLRNKFRKDFKIDCVLFNPDQEADLHTDRGQHIWMAVTDWTSAGEIDSGMSSRLANARFTVLIDEDFALEENGLPIQRAERRIEKITENIMYHRPLEVAAARSDPALASMIIQYYQNQGYLHVYINP